ncbi:hypothetical protein FF1_010701 [Malus domestica]
MCKSASGEEEISRIHTTGYPNKQKQKIRTKVLLGKKRKNKKRTTGSHSLSEPGASILLLGVSAEVEANIETEAVDVQRCRRDVDCFFFLPICEGLKYCDRGWCKCFEGQVIIDPPLASVEAYNSATAVEEAAADAKCWRDVDCEFAVKCPPGDIKFCVHGKCECVECSKNPPPADEAPNLEN